MEPARRLPFFASTPDGTVADSAVFFARGRFLLPESWEEKAAQSLGLEAFTGKKLGSYSSLADGSADEKAAHPSGLGVVSGKRAGFCFSLAAGSGSGGLTAGDTWPEAHHTSRLAHDPAPRGSYGAALPRLGAGCLSRLRAL